VQKQKLWEFVQSLMEYICNFEITELFLTRTIELFFLNSFLLNKCLDN